MLPSEGCEVGVGVQAGASESLAMFVRDWIVDLFHFSQDPSIQRFAPHVPRSNPTHPPSVWAIDEVHAPLYWFPRDCPRVTAWPRNNVEQIAFEKAFTTSAHRVHAIELNWLPAVSTTTLYRYRFDSSAFRPWPDASGQWSATQTVEPDDVTEMNDLLGSHIDANIELRAVPSLWTLRDLASSGPWDFSIVRFANARPRRRRC